MLEKTADESDAASQQEAVFTHNSIKDIQLRLKPQLHPDFQAPYCLDCGAVIPKARLDAGRIRCTDCETLIEQKLKLRR